MRKSLLLFCLATLAMILTAKAQIPFSTSSLPWRDLTEDQFKSKFVTPEDSGNYIRVFQKMNYYDSLSDHVMTLKYIDSCLLYKPDDGNLYLLKAFQYYLMRKGVAADYACRIADSLGTIDIIYLFRPMNRLFLLFDTTGVYSDLRIAMNKFADNKELWIVIGVYEFLIESPDYLQYFDKAESLASGPDTSIYYLRFVLMSQDVRAQHSTDQLLALAQNLKPMLTNDSIGLLNVYKIEYSICYHKWLLDKAKTCLEQAIQLFPNDAELNFFMAQLNFENLSEMKRYLDIAEKNAEEDPGILYNIAKLRLDISDTVAAARCYEKVLLYYDNPRALLELSDIAKAQHQKGKSDAYMKRAVHLIIRYEVYMDLIDRIDKDYALFIFDSVVGTGNNTEEAYMDRAAFNVYIHNFAAAVDDYTKALALNPANTDAWHGRGNARYLSGDKKGGCADLRKAVSLGDSSAVNIINESCGDY